MGTAAGDVSFDDYDVDFGFDVRPQKLIPIVYTKRLEQMDILRRKIHPHTTIQHITERIELESRPILQHLPKQFKNEMGSENAFKKLKNKINMINEIAEQHIEISDSDDDENDANKINNKLIPICTPIKVVLEKLDLDESKTYLVKQRHDGSVDLILNFEDSDEEIDEKMVDNNEFNDEQDDDQSIQKNTEDNIELNVTNVTKNFAFETLKDVYFIMCDTPSNDIDIYYLNKHSHVAEHYKIKNNDNKNVIYEYINNKYAYRFDFCCWQKRKETVKSLCSKKVIVKMTAKFFTKAHPCVNKCSCCCRRSANLLTVKSEGVADDDEIEYLDYEISSVLNDLQRSYPIPVTEDNDYWHDDLIKNNDVSKLINAALDYDKTVDQQNRTCMVPEKTHQVVVQIAIQNAKDDCNYHLYDVGHYGNLVSYTKTYFKDFGANHKLAQNFIFCCWFRHKKNIENIKQHLKLFTSNKLMDHIIHKSIDNTTKFMDEEHKCSVGNCICCCRLNLLKFNPSISHLILPRDLKPKRLQSKQPQVYPPSALNKIADKPTPKPKEVIPPNSESNRRPLKPVKILPAPSSFQPNQAPNQPEVVLLEDTQTQSSVDNSQVQQIIESILEKFKDVRLSINAQGKVQATLNTPVTSLCSAELKVLAQILSHAQQQVETLRLVPGTQNFASSESFGARLLSSILPTIDPNSNQNATPVPVLLKPVEPVNTSIPKIQSVYSLQPEAGTKVMAPSGPAQNTTPLIRGTKRKSDSIVSLDNISLTVCKNMASTSQSGAVTIKQSQPGTPILMQMNATPSVNFAVPNAHTPMIAVPGTSSNLPGNPVNLMPNMCPTPVFRPPMIAVPLVAVPNMLVQPLVTDETEDESGIVQGTGVHGNESPVDEVVNCYDDMVEEIEEKPDIDEMEEDSILGW